MLAFTAHSVDWAQYRGSNHDGISPDRIRKDWPANGPAEVWRVPCVNGLSSFAVSGGRAFTHIRRNDGSADQEMCIGLDARTGAELWAAPMDGASYGGGVGSDDGPRSTPSVQDGRVFATSSYLKVYCFNATNGATIWVKDLLALYGGHVIGWENAASPLVDRDLLFVNANSSSQSLMALRTTDGSLAWRSQNAPMTHSTPVLTTIAGVPQVIFAAQNGLTALNRTNGNLLWRAPYAFSYSTSLAISPVVCSNIVVISGAYGMGACAARVTSSNGTFTATPLWTNTALQAHWMTPVCHQGHLYGMFGSASSSPLKCVDVVTGQEKWSVNGFGRGGTILADNHLLVLAERGNLVLIRPDPSGCIELARFTAFPNYNSDRNKCWNVPTVADGFIYARSTAQAACWDVSVPPLKLMPPALTSGNGLRLQIGTDSGAAIDPARASKVQVRCTTNWTAALANWTALTNGLTLTNGQLRLDLAPSGGQCFYTTVEIP